MSAALTTRIAATAIAAGIAGAALSLNPFATTQASADVSVKVKDNKRGKILRDRVAKIAKAQAGESYVMGATGPNAFDCSGLVVYSYRKATGKTLPRTSYAQIASLDHVRKRDRKVGDVVFFRGGGHVGIYLGKNRIVHALNPGAGVRFDSTTSGWSGSSITGYGRVIEHR